MYSEEDPLSGDAFLCDEMSMLDVLLGDAILQAIPRGSRLILIGDVDQLPPVGPGAVLLDLIASGVVPVVRLTQVHRQAAGSMIIAGSARILRGVPPEMLDARGLDLTPGRVWYMPTLCKDGTDDPSRVIRWALQRLKTLGVDPSEVQILTPMRKGPAGTVTLNQAMQAWANPEGLPAIRDLREGDRVIQTKNVSALGIWNGDVGRLLRSWEEPKKDWRKKGPAPLETWIEVDFLDGRIVKMAGPQTSHLELAYAITVHKMQGSEARVGFVVLHPSHYRMLSRAIFYTALTRFRDTAILVGDDQTIRQACRDIASVTRHSHLVRRLRAAFEEIPHGLQPRSPEGADGEPSGDHAADGPGQDAG